MHPSFHDHEHRMPKAIALLAATILATACGDPPEDDFDRERMIAIGLDGSGGWGTGGETGPGDDGWTTTSGDLGSGGGTTTGLDSEGSGSMGVGTDTGGTDTGSYESGGTGPGGGESGGADTGSHESGGEDGSESGGTCDAVPHELNEYVEGSDMVEPPGGGPMMPPANYPPGWIDRIELETSTQCNFQNWKDSDGVDPETPGCHQAYEDKECGIPTNDKFGEECQDWDTLVETNPEQDRCHAHAIGNGGIGVGHPDRFSCSAYCWGMYGLLGWCVPADGACGDGVDSAYCECWW